ncbi:unnamed protein product [Calypogeia fissa]
MASSPTLIDLTSEEGPSNLGTGAGRGRSPLQVVSNRPIAKSKPAAKKKAVPLKNKPHALLWIPHNGAKSRTWPTLKVMGVYSTKEKAMAERERVLSQCEESEHGDIGVGDTWHDEIDLIVKPAECFFDDDRA